MNKSIYLFISILIIASVSCNKINNTNATNTTKTHNTFYSDWIKNYRLKGGVLYDSIDYFSFKGINEYKLDYLKKGEIIYGLYSFDNVYEIVEIDARDDYYNIENKPIIKYTHYHYYKDYYISTTIEFDDVASYRNVTYIHKEYIIKYFYIIDINFELLNSIEFQYKNGKESRYENPKDKFYIESNPYLKEDQVDDYFNFDIK